MEETESSIIYSLAPNDFYVFSHVFSPLPFYPSLCPFSEVVLMLERFRIRKELERMGAVVRVIEKYLGFGLEEIAIRRCFRNEELKPFKLRRNCIPIKWLSCCIDFNLRRVYITFVDHRYRCYVISFIGNHYEESVERLCRLYSSSCRLYLAIFF